MLTHTAVRCLPCLVCGEQSTLLVPSQEFENWKAGVSIQGAFPSLSADDRELLLSGTCPPCWDLLWSEDEG